MNHCVRKPTKCFGKNKGAYQLRGNREADKRLCFRYMVSTIPLLRKYNISFCDCIQSIDIIVRHFGKLHRLQCIFTFTIKIILPLPVDIIL